MQGFKVLNISILNEHIHQNSVYKRFVHLVLIVGFLFK